MFLAGIPISVSAADDGVEINETNFPDENFRYFIRVQLDENRDEQLSAEEIANITELNVTHQGISDLKGIEFFTALTTFKCSENAITEIDLSKNTLITKLDCSSCSKLTELNLSNNTSLKELDCRISNLSTLDISRNTELTTLDCSANKLTSLDVSNNVKLTNLNCHMNQLTSLDVSNNTALTELVCSSNQIAEIDVSNNTAPQSLLVLIINLLS